MLDTLRQDVRYAVRTLLRNPGFAAAAVVTLGLGIGATTAVFSVVDGVLLRPAPFERLDRLSVVWETDRNAGTIREPSSYPDYADFVQRSRRFERLAAFTPAEVSLTPERGDPARLAALAVTHAFAATVGIRPLVGRTFTEDEDRPGAPRVAIVSEALWAERCRRARVLEGCAIRINDVAHAVVGVLPSTADFGTLQILGAAAYGRGFADRGGRVRVDLWLPLRMSAATTSRDNHPIIVVGRLRDDATGAQAQQELAAIASDLERTFPSNRARGAYVEPLAQVVFGGVRPALAVLLGAVALVLLTTCANVASLLLARGVSRTREVMVRAALGAGRGRLARQFLVEGLVLTMAGAALGLAIAVAGLNALVGLAPAGIPRIGSVAISLPVLGMTLSVATLAALAFGLIPVLQLRRMDLHGALQATPGRASSGREHARLRSVLVITEVALAVMLLAGSGLLIRSLWRLQEVDPGFRAASVFKAEFELPPSRYPQDYRVWPRWTEASRFTTELRERVSRLPGVQSATVAGDQPLAAGFTSSIRVVGREAEAASWPEPSIRRVDAAYFATMGVPLLAGRGFEAADGADSRTVVAINDAARRRFFGTRDPLGQRISLWGEARTVVGIVGDERVHGLEAPAPPAVYLPTSQAPVTGGSLLVRAAAPMASLVPSVRRIVKELDGGLPVFGVESLDETVADSMEQRRFTMIVLGSFAGVALLLAIVGVHGVLSYGVARRTREIGIRIALGAKPRAVQRLVLAQGAALVAAGLGAGVLGAMAVTRGLTSMLFGVGAADPVTYLAVAALLGTVALLASWLPARRASLVDPAKALRIE